MTETIACPQCDGTGKFRDAYCDLCDQEGTILKAHWERLGRPVRLMIRLRYFGDYTVRQVACIYQGVQDDTYRVTRASMVEVEGETVLYLGDHSHNVPLDTSLDKCLDASLKSMDDYLSRDEMLRRQTEATDWLHFVNAVMADHWQEKIAFNPHGLGASFTVNSPDFPRHEFPAGLYIEANEASDEEKSIRLALSQKLNRGEVLIVRDETSGREMRLVSPSGKYTPPQVICDHKFNATDEGGYKCVYCGEESEIPF